MFFIFIRTRNNRSKNCGLLKITGKEIDESANKISFHVEFNPYYSKNSFKLELAPVENVNPPVLKMLDLKYHPKKEKGIDCTFTLIPSKTLTYDNSKIRIRVGERIKSKLILFGETEAYLSDVLSKGFSTTRVKRNGYEVGELKIKEVKRHARFTFLNYVDAGAEISLIIAMDFTKSNKEPTNPKSLHYVLNGNFFNLFTS